jgi:hypothetical protein
MTVYKYYEQINELINVVYIIEIKDANIELRDMIVHTICNKEDLKEIQEWEKEAREREEEMKKEAEELKEIVEELEKMGYEKTEIEIKRDDE